MEKHVVVILKNGLRFEHQPQLDSEEQWVDFMVEIGTPVGSEKPGTLLIHGPTSVYDMREVAAIQFGTAEDPPPPDKLALGFRPA